MKELLETFIGILLLFVLLIFIMCYHNASRSIDWSYDGVLHSIELGSNPSKYDIEERANLLLKDRCSRYFTGKMSVEEIHKLCDGF